MFRSTSGDLHISQSAYRLETLGFKRIIRNPFEGCIIHGKIHAAFIPLVSFLSIKSHTTRYPERDRLDPFTSARTGSVRSLQELQNEFTNARTGSVRSPHEHQNGFTSAWTGSVRSLHEHQNGFTSAYTGSICWIPSRAPERVHQLQDGIG